MSSCTSLICHPRALDVSVSESGTQYQIYIDPTKQKMVSKYYFVYILASKRNGTLYIGVTNDILRRIQQHKEGKIPGFTKDYNVNILVYYEAHEDINQAILREKQMKKWARKYKLDLIEKNNPEWNDLYSELMRKDTGSPMPC